MANKKESFFWTSYSDLMTSLFFIMLVLFVLVIAVLYKKAQATEAQLAEIRKIEASTKDLDREYFTYRPEYKKFVLKVEGRYEARDHNIHNIKSDNKQELLLNIANAGKEIQNFLDRHRDTQYILIVEGQSSRDDWHSNYELSYQRALGLMRYWMDEQGIKFGDNCEILICGSGDGKLDTHSSREPVQVDNQRFLIHILPKNIMETQNEKSGH